MKTEEITKFIKPKASRTSGREWYVKSMRIINCCEPNVNRLRVLNQG